MKICYLCKKKCKKLIKITPTGHGMAIKICKDCHDKRIKELKS